MVKTAETPETHDTPDHVVDVAPSMLRAWLARGDAVLIDVREDFEHAQERIDGAEHEPLGSLDPERIRAAHEGKRIVFHCRTGKRSHEAARRVRALGEPAFHLAGGIEAWKAEGEPVTRPPGGPPIPIMRQVQIAAGSLVVIGVALGLTLSPWWLAVPAFVGCGLVFAGVSGWCGMAKLLSRMPWNKPSPA